MPYNSDIIVIGCGNILFKDDEELIYQAGSDKTITSLAKFIDIDDDETHKIHYDYCDSFKIHSKFNFRN